VRVKEKEKKCSRSFTSTRSLFIISFLDFDYIYIHFAQFKAVLERKRGAHNNDSMAHKNTFRSKCRYRAGRKYDFSGTHPNSCNNSVATLDRRKVDCFVPSPKRVNINHSCSRFRSCLRPRCPNPNHFPSCARGANQANYRHYSHIA